MSAPRPAALVVPARFCGPPGSGNGGWVAGALAAFLPGAAAVRVRLAAPPPLDVPLDVLVDGTVARLRHGGTDVAEALAVDAAQARPDGDPDPFVGPGPAAAAESRYPGGTDHPFPTCVVCSPLRDDPAALRLRPGPVDGDEGRTATTWRPAAVHDAGDGTVDPAVVWAALDCPGGWAVGLAGRPMVLGTMTAQVLRAPAVGEPCVVVGSARGGSGRTARTSTTLWSAAGEPLARAVAVWVAVDPATFGR